jgi:hypothetical protein
MYLAASWDLFTHQFAFGYWTALTLLATAGLLFGYVVRVRLFFLLGGCFLLGNCLALLTQQTLAHPQWITFILVGVGLTVLAVAIFWRQIGETWRDWNERWEE